MGKLLLLYLTFVVGLVFLLMPDKMSPHDFFLFSDMKLYPSAYIYFAMEKVVLIILAYIIYSESTEYRGAIQVFLWLLVADLGDYFLSYNSVWGYLGSFPVSMNVLKCVIFGGTILYVWSRTLFK